VPRRLLATVRDKLRVTREEHFDDWSAGDMFRAYGPEQGNMPCMHIEPVIETRRQG